MQSPSHKWCGQEAHALQLHVELCCPRRPLRSVPRGSREPRGFLWFLYSCWHSDSYGSYGSPWFPLVPMVPIPMVPVMEKPFEFFHLLLIPHVLCSGATPLWNVGPFDRIPQPPQRAMLEATGFRLLTYWQRTLVWLKPWCSTEQFEGCLHSSACYDQLNLWKTHSGCFPILRPWS